MVVFAAAVEAGPVEFGKAEVERAIAARGLKASRFRFRTEITSDGLESYRILGTRITGGDLRGLMYGLLDAAEQIRNTGRVVASKGSPATPIRGIRTFIHNKDLEEDWYYSKDYWREFFAMLARNRFNRFNLVFAHQTDYLAPPYPYWLSLDDFPNVHVPSLSAAQRDRNLEMLRFISQTAADHAIDFTLGIWEHNVQRGMKPTVVGLTRENIGPYSYAALKKLLAACPAIRSIQMRTNSESGIPADQQVEFYRDWVYRAIREAGRLVTLDLRGWVMSRGMLEAATSAGMPVRLSSKYWAEDLGRPYQPAETYPNYSYINFLKKPRPYNFYWEIWALGSNRLLLWGNPGFVRRAVPTLTLSGSLGFEIDAPLAQKGFGNRPGKWGIFTPANKSRMFWKWEFERYWFFYMLWGRLSYDPKTSEKVWMAELQRRFGKAAPDVLEAYENASGVLSEIVAAHLADPNMYLWPEINPGGLIDDYKDVLPSDWRYIASISEAVKDRIRGIASAKQTPKDTAALLDKLAEATEQAVKRAAAKLGPTHREWSSSEPDFRVLAALARYHARKLVAADQLTYFYETSDPAGLHAAKRELTQALRIWEGLVQLTDGLYPEQMAFGPADIGHWKDKLPYVRYDLKLIEDREQIFERFGRFDFGFDFGGPPAERRGGSYRNTPYVLHNTVEPRFHAIGPTTDYAEAKGYGWASKGQREAVALPLTPYAEIRAVERNPQHLPENVLFGDSIRGRGPQTFRVRTGNGEFMVTLLYPDGNATAAPKRPHNGFIDIVFPEAPWTVSGIIVKNVHGDEAPKPQAWPKPLQGPTITHIPPKTVAAGKPLTLSLRMVPTKNVTSVRLHYRPVNQLAEFKTLEAAPAKAVFTIPAADIPAGWDLMYYFEILNSEKTGWFYPDPATSTPYFVVNVEGSNGTGSK
jgi:hypothetical protein